MSVTVYEGKNFEGAPMHLDIGDYDKHYMEVAQGSGQKIGSIRIDAGTLLVVSDSTSIAARGTRIFVGPSTVNNVEHLGLYGDIVSLKVRSFVESGHPSLGPVEVFTGVGYDGLNRMLGVGDYPVGRLVTSEDGGPALPDNSIQSIKVPEGVVVILYDGPNFDAGLKSIFIVGPSNIADLNTYGISKMISSIKVISIDVAPEPELRGESASLNYVSRQQRGLHKVNPNFMGDTSHDGIMDSENISYSRKPAPSRTGAMLQMFNKNSNYYNASGGGGEDGEDGGGGSGEGGGTAPHNPSRIPMSRNIGQEGMANRKTINPFDDLMASKRIEGFCSMTKRHGRALEPGIYANSPDMLYDARLMYSKMGIRFVMLILVIVIVLLVITLRNSDNDGDSDSGSQRKGLGIAVIPTVNVKA